MNAEPLRKISATSPTTNHTSADTHALVHRYNQRLMKKMLWMAEQLGGFNDSVSIANWANSMALIKNLLCTSPTDTTIKLPSHVDRTAHMTITKPSSISYNIRAHPAMSIKSESSSNPLPSPSPTSSCKVDVELIPTTSTCVVNKKPLSQFYHGNQHTTLPAQPLSSSCKLDVKPIPTTSTCVINKEPLSPLYQSNQHTTMPAQPLSSCKYPRNTSTVQSTLKCTACNNNLGYFYRNETIAKACVHCKRSTNSPAGPSNLWVCSCCGYDSCFGCLKKTATLYLIKKHQRKKDAN
jgi:hypothetical protein